MTDDGLISVDSKYSARETTERLLAALPARNMTVFGRVDHAANATAAGMALRPTELIIFGNPKGGTILMQDRQRAGIDLPLKALVWEDADGKAWVTYNDPAWIARRHGLDNDAAIEVMVKAMNAIAQDATK
jgi:uncharacterized protein (DUF302 family)